MYIYIYIHFFRPFFGPNSPRNNHHRSNNFYDGWTSTRSINHHQKKFFHRFPHEFTIFHKISPSKNTKKHQNPQNREKPEKTVFLGVPPHPPQKPLFSRVFGTPQIAQICTNLHKFAPICTPKTPLLGGTQFAGTLWIDPVRIFAKSGRAGITPILGGYRGGTPSVHNYTPPGPPRLYLNK